MLQLYPLGTSDAISYAVGFLSKSGLNIVDHPTPEVTHLLLDVPSFKGGAQLTREYTLEKILEILPQHITVVGGNLAHPLLAQYRLWDFLQDEEYLAQNAAITASCAMRLAAPLLPTTFAQSPTLILGWGRIGKCLGQMLRSLGCHVTIAARNPKDRAALRSMGYTAADPTDLQDLSAYRLLFNTVPAPVLSQQALLCRKNCVKIDLASQPGLEGSDVVWARGLPGIYAPESSGRLIADTFLRKTKEALL